MGVYLPTPKTEKTSLNFESDRYLVAASEMQGWRTTMEDAKIVSLDPDGSTVYLGVFDGHGGKDVSAYTATHILNFLKANPKFKAGLVEQSLPEVFLQVDEALLSQEGLDAIRELSGNPQPNEVVLASGCTAVMAVIKEDVLYVANAGDSRCVVARGGSAIAMSNDHKPDLLEERNRIERAGGTVEEGRVMGNLNLSRSLGDLRYKQTSSLAAKDQMITGYPDVRVMPITPDVDFVVLACDGVWDMLTSKDCIEFIYERLGSSPLQQIVEDLLQRCLAKDVMSHGGLGCDNTTCIVLVFKHPE